MSKSIPPPSECEYIRELLHKVVEIYWDHDGSSPLAQGGNCYSFAPKTKILRLVVPCIQEKCPGLLAEIYKFYYDLGYPILREATRIILNSYEKYAASDAHDKDLLEFFQPILHRSDFFALKMSLFLRYESRYLESDIPERGRILHKLKTDIRDKFRHRGDMIANLCTAGYFESEFMPMAKDSVDDFKEYFEIAVGEKARALFIHANMSLYDIEKAFEDILGKAIRFHMEDFRIHAMGRKNVEKLMEFIDGQTPTDEYEIEELNKKSIPSPLAEYIVKIKYFQVD